MHDHQQLHTLWVAPMCVRFQEDMKHWPFKVKQGPADKPLIEGGHLMRRGEGRKQHMEYLNAATLRP